MSFIPFRYGLFLLFVTLLTVSCKTTHSSQGFKERPAIVTFPDSIQASQLIISEDESEFFSDLKPLDRHIQMKTDDEDMSLEMYKDFLKSQVSNWKTEEKIQLYTLMEEVKKLCDTLSPRLFPPDLKLVKIKTDHYGRDVFYTKGRTVFVPENIFVSFAKDRYFPVFVHELFHIISRFHPEMRHELYGLIGFKPCDKPVELNDFLKNRKLTNPDAISYQYCIILEHEGRKYKAIPLIYSKFGQYKNSHTSFFDYLTFDMFELIELEHHYLAVTNNTGKSSLPPEVMESFFNQIKDNTQYIIHPEEIMADNFMLSLLAYSKGDYKKFSPEGKELIDSVLEILKKI